MAKFQSPLLGYNNNVRHRGRVFHIQTEDSGVNHPHIITHLFMDGGRILKSVKTSYAEHVDAEGWRETVKVMMKEQHKAMLIALRDGQFDELVDGKKGSGGVAAPRSGEAPKAPASEPNAKVEAPASGATAKAPVAAAAPPLLVQAPTPEVLPEPPTERSMAPLVAAEEHAPVEDEAIPLSKARPSAPELSSVEVGPVVEITIEVPGPSPTQLGLGREVAALRGGNDEADPKTMREAEQIRASASELTLDFDALERDSSGSNAYYTRSDLPPPPKNLFSKERGTGAYSAVEDIDAHHDVPRMPSYRPPAPARARSIPPPPAPVPSFPNANAGRSVPPGRSVAPKAPNEGRYAPARPAAIFGSTAKQTSPSIFSDELVSDKSLDEVILSYLAEDLEPPRRK